METRHASQLFATRLITSPLFSLSYGARLLSAQPLRTHAPPPPSLELTLQMEA